MPTDSYPARGLDRLKTTAVGIKLAYIFYSRGTSRGVTRIDVEAVATKRTTVKMAACLARYQNP